ncbi:MAG: hypothetical protein E3J60_03445 [Dehalococcoidia bacterium]|nr:MAG: hypothetical protein E3J60_03445 [Dehalococcoidia bacterium]
MDLIKAGYAKSSVYYVLKKLKAARENLPARMSKLEKRFAALCELFESEMDRTRKDHPGPWRIIDGKDWEQKHKSST